MNRYHQWMSLLLIGTVFILGCSMISCNTAKTRPPTFNNLTPTPYLKELDYPYPDQETRPLTSMAVQAYPLPTYPHIPQKTLPHFSQVTLTTSDIPYSADPLFNFYIPIRAEYQDRSGELVDMCNIDCIKRIWSLPEQHKSFVIVMYQVNDPDFAKSEVTDSLDHVVGNFTTKRVSNTLSGLPDHSWIAASQGIEGTVGERITLWMSFGSTVVVLSEQGDLSLDELNLDEYFLTIQKLASIQLEKLKSAGYTENH